VLGDPVNLVDVGGLRTEIVIWAPVGTGQSSFGHISVDINGITYSMTPSGMKMIPRSEYFNINSFRDAIGLELNVTGAQESFIENYLKNNQSRYNLISNNCGDPIENALENLGYDLGINLFPNSLGASIIEQGLVGDYHFYPKR
jgi:hypothetical protein